MKKQTPSKEVKYFSKIIDNVEKKLNSKQKAPGILQKRQDKVIFEFEEKSNKIQKDITELNEKYYSAWLGLQSQEASDYASKNCTFDCTYKYDYGVLKKVANVCKTMISSEKK